MRDDFLPYGRQWIDEDDIQAVINVLKSDYLTTGPAIEEFENQLKTITGAEYAVAISNGTAALHAACFAAGIGEGDEVITTPMTFAATSNAVLYGGTRFCHISQTYNIDPKISEEKSQISKGNYTVHYTGQPVIWMRLCKSPKAQSDCYRRCSMPGQNTGKKNWKHRGYDL